MTTPEHSAATAGTGARRASTETSEPGEAGTAGTFEAPGSPRAYEWVSAHLFYHGDLDRLVSELVGPVTDELAAEVLARRVFFLRYWEGGSHLRLRVLPTAGRRLEVMAVLQRRADAFFRRCPAADDPAIAEYPQWGAQLAAAEGRAAYAEVPYPNNSLRFIPYVREHDRYGEGRSITAVERHFVESSALALRLVRDGLEPGRRDTVGFLALLVTWFCGEPDPRRLRAHLANGYAGWRQAGHEDVLESGASQEPEHEDAYRRQAERLRTLAVRARALATASSADPKDAPRDSSGGSPDSSRPITRWAADVARLRGALLAIADAGRTVPNGRMVADGPTMPGGRGPTAGDVPSEPYARIASVLDLCTHLFCNRIGISIGGEHHLRYLAHRAVGNLADVEDGTADTTADDTEEGQR